VAGWDDLPGEGQPTETCHSLPQVTTAYRGPTVHLPAGYREPTVRRLNFDEEPRIYTNQHKFHFGLAVLRPSGRVVYDSITQPVRLAKVWRPFRTFEWVH